MSRPIELEEFVEQRAADGVDVDTPRWLRPIAATLHQVNRLMVGIGMVAALVLTSSVVTRYVLHASTDWQDETAVFCLVGATFLCAAYVQSLRGHVGIEALVTLLPARVDGLRQLLVDVVSLLFCTFFAWKAWALFHEAWVDKQTTSSTWAPPLSIPYGLMSVGMSLLCLQLAVQSIVGDARLAKPIAAARGPRSPSACCARPRRWS